MNKNRVIIILFIILAVVFGVLTYHQHQKNKIPSHAEEVPSVPVKGMVTMLDLGATECIPCKMMAPILVG